MNTEGRLAQLEKQTRWLKAAAVVIVLSVAAMGSRSTEVVSAERFDLVNGEGETIGVWGPNPKTGETTFMFSAGKGKPVVRMDVSPTLAGLLVSDGLSHRAHLLASPKKARVVIEEDGQETFSAP